MKALIIFLSFLLTGTVIQAQERSVSTSTAIVVVPDMVKAAFNNEFPGIQPKWVADDKNYKAIYADPKTNSKGIISYDPEGKVIRRDVEVHKNPE
jgi:hypothetical protein